MGGLNTRGAITTVMPLALLHVDRQTVAQVDCFYYIHSYSSEVRNILKNSNQNGCKNEYFQVTVLHCLHNHIPTG